MTVEAYSHEFETYIRNTPKEYTLAHTPLIDWIDRCVRLLEPDSYVLEIGSATPRDASHIRSTGHIVRTSDACTKFVQYLRDNGESDAMKLNVLTDEITGHYDMFFANAVVPHFTKNDLEVVLRKIYDRLPVGGIFAFNAKEGTGHEWIFEKLHEKRFVKYWQIDALKKIVEECGYTIEIIERGIIGDLPNHSWIRIAARKPN